MKKNILIFLTAFVFLFSFAIAQGFSIDLEKVQEPDSSPEQKIETRERIQDFTEIREQKTQQIRERKEEFLQEVNQKREQVVTQVQERKILFEAKVQEIRNEKMRERANILSRNINRVNENLCKSYTGFLNALELVLEKIESRIQKIEDATGSDLTLVYEKAEEIRQMINLAWEGIAEQKSKHYLPELESEETIVQNFGDTIQQVHQDHRQLRETYISPLRQSIREVMLVLKDAVSTD